MKRCRGVLAIVLLTFVFTLTGCGAKVDKQLIGTWEYKDEDMKSVYVFKADGKGSQTLTVGDNSSKNKYIYEIKDGKILITFENDTDVFEYGYRFSGKDLVLKDTFGEEFTCKKKF